MIVRRGHRDEEVVWSSITNIRDEFAKHVHPVGDLGLLHHTTGGVRGSSTSTHIGHGAETAEETIRRGEAPRIRLAKLCHEINGNTESGR